jgi:hypothetical protein
MHSSFCNPTSARNAGNAFFLFLQHSRDCCAHKELMQGDNQESLLGIFQLSEEFSS